MDNKRIFAACFIFFILLFLIPPVSASTTTLTITVTDDYDGSAIEDASIYIAGTYVGETDSDGEYEYTHSKSEKFRVTIKKDGYDYWTDMVSYTRTSLDVKLERASGSLTINILDSDTLKPIEDAIVKVSGDDIDDSESTDDDGSAEFSVYTGSTYIVVVKKDNYNSIEREVEMDESSMDVDYLLQRNDRVIFQVTESESGLPLDGVSVYIDGDLEGVTDSEGRLNVYLDHEESYYIEIKVDEYQSYTDTHYFGIDDIIYSVSISKTLYPVSIAVYDSNKVPIEEAEIYIDDIYFGKSDDYGQSDVTNLNAGEHTFEIRKTGYSDWEETVLIDGVGDNIVATMESIRADVTVVVEDSNHNAISGASVILDGKSIGSTNSQGTITTELLTDSDYTFSVTKDGYKDLTQTEDVPLGSTEMTITLTMESSFNTALLGGVVVLIVIVVIVVYALKFVGKRDRRGRGRYPGGRDGGSL
ncbi:carboxypeptidase-like regulatory domain-containing protein [Methanolacinia paynteri]|uniref:carboxypeptidase-like regulatory domain-containing protein n=1 Tax=Methanolacinia paynteri TaxID=230356 RepID=UPI00064F6690|nr:carboxypeptidase-like regulatory domain-containing protein [Methanolacinia paynteri]